MSHNMAANPTEYGRISPMEILIVDPQPNDHDATEALFVVESGDSSRRRTVLLQKNILFRFALGLGILVLLGLLVPRGWQATRAPARLSFVPASGDATATATFTIMQLADIHLGEAQNTDWGPQQDAKTWRALDRYLQHHRRSSSEPVQLLVLSGDQITANDFTKRNATEYYLELGHRLSKYKIPFCFIFGNHDDKPNDRTQSNSTNRQELMRVMQQHFRHWSLARPGPSDVTGVSNYWLSVYHYHHDTQQQQETDTAVRLLFLDTGGGQLAQQIDESHLTWMIQTNQEYQNVPVVTFAHIPTNEFQYIDNNGQCVGENGEGGIAALQDYDAGLVSALARSMPNVAFLAVGHNHGNDYCCAYASSSEDDAEEAQQEQSALHLCFGRHSGYGGYGSWDRGARMYQLTLSNNEVENAFEWKSWVLMESGDTQDYYGPFS